MKHLSLLIIAALGLAACSPSEGVDIVQPGDNRLSCQDINAEFNRLKDAEKAINEKKGLNATNVAGAIFWIPGLAYTYYDAGQAEETITERRAHLTDLYNKKGC